MAITTYGTGLGDAYIEFKALSNTVKNDVYVGAATCKIYQVVIDATKNPGEDTWLRMWDNAAPVNGTTAVDFLLPAPKAKKISYTFPNYLDFDTNGLSLCMSRNPGGESGTDGPTGTVDVYLIAAA